MLQRVSLSNGIWKSQEFKGEINVIPQITAFQRI